MKQILIACLVMLIAACTTTTGKNDADLGSGNNRTTAPVRSEPKQSTAKPGEPAAQANAARSAAQTKDATSTQSAAVPAGKQPSTVQPASSGPAQSAGTVPSQSSAQATGSSATQAGTPPPDVAPAPITAQQQSEAEMHQLESAPTTTPVPAESATQPQQAAAISQSAADPVIEPAQAQASSSDKTASAAAAALPADNTKAAPGKSDSTATRNPEPAKAQAPKQDLARDGDDSGNTETVTEQQLKTANPMLTERSVYYDFDKYDIKEQYAHIIEAHANFLVEHPTIKITVEGNCDDRGSPEYNLVLGQRRAESVQKAMTALGVSPQQIESVSFGAERPVAPGHDEENWAKNRRSDIVYPTRER